MLKDFALTGGLGKLGILKSSGDYKSAIDNVARPEDIQYSGLANESGDLMSRFSMRQQPRGEFEQRLRGQALSSAPSASTLQQAQYAQRGAQSGFNQGVSNLAQSGGVSSGSRERLARQAALQGMQGRQQALAAGEQQKLDLQNTFANQEGSDRRTDVQSLIGNKQRQDQFNLDQYKSKLAEYAGAQLGRQQEALSKTSGGLLGGGGILGSGFSL